VKKPTRKTSAKSPRRKAFRVVMFKYLVKRIELYVEALDEEAAKQVALDGRPKTETKFRRVLVYEGEPNPQHPVDAQIESITPTPLAQTAVSVQTVDDPEHTWACPICYSVNDIEPRKYRKGDLLECVECKERFEFNGEIF